MNEHLKETEIQQLVEASLDFSKSLMTHLNSCAACKLRFNEYKAFFESLKEMPTPVIPDLFADNVVQAVKVKRQKEYLLKQQLIYACIAGIASLLIGFLFDTLSFLSTVSVQMVVTIGFLSFFFIALKGHGKVYRKEELLSDLTL